MYYPATVTGVTDTGYTVRFDDDDEGVGLQHDEMVSLCLSIVLIQIAERFQKNCLPVHPRSRQQHVNSVCTVRCANSHFFPNTPLTITCVSSRCLSGSIATAHRIWTLIFVNTLLCLVKHAYSCAWRTQKRESKALRSNAWARSAS